MTSIGALEPWEQQPGESARAYKAFSVYRDLGLTRSLSKLSEHLGKGGAKVGQKRGKNRTLFERWSSRHYWVVRAAAWDRELDRAWVLESRQRRREVQRRNAEVAAGAMELVASCLRMLSPDDLTVLDLVRLVSAFAPLEWRALDVDTSSQAGRQPNVVEAIPELLTAEDRIALLLKMRDEINRQLAIYEPAGVETVRVLPQHDEISERRYLQIAG